MRWDCDVAQMGALRALEELGRVEELRRRLPGLIDEAISLDDLYAEVTFRLYDAFWKISRGETEQARSTAADVLARWGREGFQLQHLYELRIQALCDVYEGAPQEALRRVDAPGRRLERSGLLAHRMLRERRAPAPCARCAAAAGAQVEREAGRAARALERMQRPDAVAAARLLRSALAARVRRAAARHRAARAAESATRAPRWCCTSRTRGEGAASCWAATRVTRWSGRRSVRSRAQVRARTSRWLELHAPGFRASPG